MEVPDWAVYKAFYTAANDAGFYFLRLEKKSWTADLDKARHLLAQAHHDVNTPFEPTRPAFQGPMDRLVHYSRSQWNGLAGVFVD